MRYTMLGPDGKPASSVELDGSSPLTAVMNVDAQTVRMFELDGSLIGEVPLDAKPVLSACAITVVSGRGVRIFA